MQRSAHGSAGTARSHDGTRTPERALTCDTHATPLLSALSPIARPPRSTRRSSGAGGGESHARAKTKIRQERAMSCMAACGCQAQVSGTARPNASQPRSTHLCSRLSICTWQQRLQLYTWQSGAGAGCARTNLSLRLPRLAACQQRTGVRMPTSRRVRDEAHSAHTLEAPAVGVGALEAPAVGVGCLLRPRRLEIALLELAAEAVRRELGAVEVAVAVLVHLPFLQLRHLRTTRATRGARGRESADMKARMPSVR